MICSGADIFSCAYVCAPTADIRASALTLNEPQPCWDTPSRVLGAATTKSTARALPFRRTLLARPRLLLPARVSAWPTSVNVGTVTLKAPLSFFAQRIALPTIITPTVPLGFVSESAEFPKYKSESLEF